MGTLHLFNEQGQKLFSVVCKKKGKDTFIREGQDLNLFFHSAIFESTEKGVLHEKDRNRIWAAVGDYKLTSQYGDTGHSFYSDDNMLIIKVFTSTPSEYEKTIIQTFEFFGKATSQLTLVELPVSQKQKQKKK